MSKISEQNIICCYTSQEHGWRGLHRERGHLSRYFYRRNPSVSSLVGVIWLTRFSIPSYLCSYVKGSLSILVKWVFWASPSCLTRMSVKFKGKALSRLYSWILDPSVDKIFLWLKGPLPPSSMPSKTNPYWRESSVILALWVKLLHAFIITYLVLSS